MPTISSTIERVHALGLRWPEMNGGECLVVVDIADDILRHAQRHRDDLAAVLATEPVVDGSPIDRPLWRADSRTKVQVIYDYMRANDQWLTMQTIADALNMKYETLKYSFSQMKRHGYVVRGSDLPRTDGNGGSPYHQYRLARKQAQESTTREPIAA